MLKLKELSDPCQGIPKGERCDSCSESPYWQGQQRPTPESSTAAGEAPEPCHIAPVTLEEELATAKKLYVQSRSAMLEMFSHARMGRAITVDKADTLVDDIRQSIARHPNAFISLVRLKNANEYTYMHCVAVCALMIAVAQQLELSPELVHQAGLAGLLHDVGKLAVSATLLNKPGKLTADEFAIIRQHPELGAQLLRTSVPVCELVLDVCLHHHEKIDGTGYPFGLAGDEISMAARMGAICDVYDAVTSNRPYKDPWTPAMALGRMGQWQGHFDERLMGVFINSLGLYPAGGLVRLNDHRLALIVDNCPEELMAIRVLPFYCTSRLQEIKPQELIVRPDQGPQILGIERPDFWHFEDWAALRSSVLAKAQGLSAAA